jgi:hypothetical protein
MVGIIDTIVHFLGLDTEHLDDLLNLCAKCISEGGEFVSRLRGFVRVIDSDPMIL